MGAGEPVLAAARARGGGPAAASDGPRGSAGGERAHRPSHAAGHTGAWGHGQWPRGPTTPPSTRSLGAGLRRRAGPARGALRRAVAGARRRHARVGGAAQRPLAQVLLLHRQPQRQAPRGRLGHADGAGAELPPRAVPAPWPSEARRHPHHLRLLLRRQGDYWPGQCVPPYPYCSSLPSLCPLIVPRQARGVVGQHEADARCRGRGRGRCGGRRGGAVGGPGAPHHRRQCGPRPVGSRAPSGRRRRAARVQAAGDGADQRAVDAQGG